jgi:hypothetical protein
MTGPSCVVLFRESNLAPGKFLCGVFTDDAAHTAEQKAATWIEQFIATYPEFTNANFLRTKTLLY